MSNELECLNYFNIARTSAQTETIVKQRYVQQSTSMNLALFLALALAPHGMRNFLPTSDSNEGGYPNPEGICKNIVCVVM